MTNIKLILKGAKARAKVNGVLTSGMVGIPVTIEYDDTWQALAKNLVCRCGKRYDPPEKGMTRIVANIDTTATVAHEVMEAGMYLYLGVEGYSADGSKVMPTTWAECGMILQGVHAHDEESEDPTLPVWAQLEADVAQLKYGAVTEEKIAQAVEDYLKENPIEVPDDSQNADSAVLYTAQTLNDEQKAQARENIGAAAMAALTDEELIAEGYTLSAASDYLHGMWTGAGAYWDAVENGYPEHTRWCTRKFAVSRLPQINASQNPLSLVFWRAGTVISEVQYSVLSENYYVDFVFDEMAINFGYGWENWNAAVIKLSFDVQKFSKVLVLGDSISTDYYGNYTKWVTVLKDEGFLPAATTNDSIHATGFVARYNGEENDFISRIESVSNPDTYDLVIVFGGINDYIQAIPLGESGGDKLVSFVPAVDSFFDYLVNHFTQARIVVLSPLRTYNVYNNTAGHHQTEYTDYIKQAARSYCLPVLDLTEESGFCPFNETFKEMWTLVPDGYENADGVHPNEAYQRKFLAPRIRNYLAQFA